MTTALCGDLVALRPFEQEDAPALRTYLNHPALLERRYLPWGIPDNLPLSTRHIHDILNRWYEGKNSLTLAVIEQASGDLVGHARMNWGWDMHMPDVFAVIDPARWRSGFGSDTMHILLNHLYSTSVAHNISAWCDEWNREGRSFLLAQGFTEAGKMRRAGIRDGRFTDLICYDMLRPEWRARNRRESE